MTLQFFSLFYFLESSLSAVSSEATPALFLSSVYPECNVQMFLLRYIYLKHWVNKHICDPWLLLQKVQVQMYNIMGQH